MSRKTGHAALAVMALGIAAGGASRADDITYGGDARAFAMGGAGIAATNQENGARRFNPAALALEQGKFAVYVPSVGLRSTGGIGIGRVADFLTQTPDANEAVDLARDVGGEDSEIGINASLGFRVGLIEVTATGVGRGRILPNQALRSFVNAGGNLNDLNNLPAVSAARADVLAAAIYSLPTVSFAGRIPSQNPTTAVEVGARVKYLNAVYTHYVADANALGGGGGALLAPEMNGDDTITKNGLGIDVGFLAHPRNAAAGGFSYALVVNNLVRPGFTIAGTGRDGVLAEYNLLATTASVGAAYQKKSTTLVADLVDLTGEDGEVQLRLGAEQRVGGKLAVRGGYSSAQGFTYGVGVAGFDLAFGKRAPLEITKTLRF